MFFPIINLNWKIISSLPYFHPSSFLKCNHILITIGYISLCLCFWCVLSNKPQHTNVCDSPRLKRTRNLRQTNSRWSNCRERSLLTSSWAWLNKLLRVAPACDAMTAKSTWNKRKVFNTKQMYVSVINSLPFFYILHLETTAKACGYLLFLASRSV